MKFKNLQSIFECLGLGKIQENPIAIKKSIVWYLCSDKGEFVVKKISPHSFAQAKNGELISLLLKEQSLPVISAMRRDSVSIFEENQDFFMIFPYVAGEVASYPIDDINKIKKIGMLLSRIHAAKLSMPECLPAVWQSFEMPDWVKLFSRFPYLERKGYSFLYENWSNACLKGISQVVGNKIISHGDLYPPNVIWENSTRPWIIDWLNAGTIHPQVDLLNVAVNWAGISEGPLRKKSFMCLLEAYHDKGGEIAINEPVLWASLASWLNWLSYHLSLEDEPIITESLGSIHRLMNSFEHLLVWI